MGTPINGILTRDKAIRIPGVESHLAILEMSEINDNDLTPDFLKWGLVPPRADDADVWLLKIGETRTF